MVTSRSVLVLGGATEDGIGNAICSRLSELGHLAFAPNQRAFNVINDPMADLLEECEPDSVVYAVGANILEWSHSIDFHDYQAIMDTNLWGFINVISQLQETGRAYSVLAITSDAAVRPMRTSMVYCASKAALNMAIRVASRELASSGWRINGLAPGKVEGTAMTRYVDHTVLLLRNWSKEFADQYEKQSSAIRRPVTREEVAKVACDVLLSDVLAWTGDIVTVNGGR